VEDGARRLGCYVMPGGSNDPLAGLEQAKAAESLGLGSVWLSERWASKELGAMGGAIAASTRRVRIVAGITHFGTRHPVVLAGLGTTLQALSGGRFEIGVGRSIPNLWPMLGLPLPNLRALEDHASILRGLWASETVKYDGPAGTYPRLRATDTPDVAAPPLLLAAIGPKTVALAGRVFDGVILHPFLTREAVGRAREAVRDAAAAAGRDPDAVRIYGQIVIAPDMDSTGADEIVAARALTYFDMAGLGDALFEANGWERGTLGRVRAHPLMEKVTTFADHDLTVAERIEIVADTVPGEWLADTSAGGTATAVAGRIGEYLEAGLDEIVLHGTTAEHLGPVVTAFEAQQQTEVRP
jgi:probable F420-dependent oxidoreductase